jgi:hypothetical protein
MIDTRPLNNKTVNFINWIGKLLMDLKVPITQMDEEVLYQQAIDSTGLDDFGNDYYREGFKQAFDSAKKDVHFHFLGQLIFTTMMTMNLANRLQLVEKTKRTPEVFQRPVRAPIFILGLPRSGSTRLHRMLDLDPMLKGPQLWEMIRPILVNPPDRRFQTAKREISMSMLIYRGRDHIHYSRAHTPEECVMLLGPTFFSQSYWTQAPVYSYIDWYIQQDRTIPYQEYKWYLQILQDSYPGQHLLLKAPAHMGSLDQILELFPDARIIQTHRNPVPVVNSINSLNFSTHIRATQTYDVLKTAEHTTQLWLAETHRNLEARQANPGKVYDVYFRDFVGDPIGTIRGIYNHFDLVWAEDFDQLLEQYNQDNPKNKFGQHNYASEDFGTTDEAILKKFETYCEMFGYTDSKGSAAR